MPYIKSTAHYVNGYLEIKNELIEDYIIIRVINKNNMKLKEAKVTA